MFWNIEVKQAHIDNGKRVDAEFCAVACAIREETSADFVSVGTTSASVRISKTLYRFKLSPEVQTFIAYFDDCNEAARPFTFTANVETVQDWYGEEIDYSV